MIKIQFTICLLFSFFIQYSNAQVSNLNLQYNSVPGIGCHSNMSVCLTSGSLPESGAQIIVDWTDGTMDTIMAYLAPSSQSCYLAEHDYNQAGIYHAVVTVTSGTLGGQLVGTETIEWVVTSTSNCGFFSLISLLNPSSTFLQNVPYDMINSAGTVTTVYPKNSFGNMYYSELDIAAVPYTVSINDQWLQNNGYAQTSPDFTINSFDVSGRAENTPINVTLECVGTGAIPDLELTTATGFQFIAPLQTGNIHVQLCNISCGNYANSTLKIVVPPTVIPDLTAWPNATFTNDTITFSLPYLTGCQSIGFPCSFPGNTPAGTIYNFNAIVEAENESNFLFNQLPFNAVVLNSLDPNEKQCNLPHYIQPDVLENLQYTIHFQNDGNFPALNVEVRDTISSNLDLSTFRFIQSKHPVSYTIDALSRAITFRFSGISLTSSAQNMDSSQGYFTYSISENPGLPLNSVISNTASIYFDYNPAIVTNTTTNVNAYLGIENSKKNEIGIVPNPTSGSCLISTPKGGVLSIYGLQGNRVYHQAISSNEQLQLNHLNAGMYQIILVTDDTVWKEKLIIE
jgi:uncharacterized repeat protein (TIGR01451 family)